ncbi:hypothetical protein [Actinomadura geliboluensis]|uniref:hypothetical protein n=1 Tax=Actinomadura geliboluensis TaxID=882440 RepID=UPI0014863DD2|nr:hypothetical protein [Actinomadura geliboluensis]
MSFPLGFGAYGVDEGVVGLIVCVGALLVDEATAADSLEEVFQKVIGGSRGIEGVVRIS